ncbi:MAG TPA: hypothetical protein VK829_20505 [Terriglobales bacterium]|nr:hypothetical protein [Terriglobales bacterium]
MKKMVLARTLLGLAVLMLIGVTALAQDNSKSTITINGGRNTISMKAPARVHAPKAPCTPAKFYDDICNGNINVGSGWTVSDGSPINTEFTPANQIISLNSGTTKTLTITVGFVVGTNGAIVDLDRDCSGLPCGAHGDGGLHLCQGKLSNMYTFGNAIVAETFKCVTTLKKGKPYWVYVQSDANSWLAWNLSNTATAGFVEGTNDAWGTAASGQPIGGLAIN